MRFQLLALATLTLAVACGPRDRDCGPYGLIYVEGMGCVCPMGTRYVCDEGTTVCMCEPLDAGTTPDGSLDAGIPMDAPSDGGCTGPGETMCGSECVDTRTSAEHCGGCDDPCGSPMRCVDSACVDPAIAVETAHSHTCSLRASGIVECWGSNADGQVGDGTTIERHVPTRVLDIDDAVQIAVSGLNPLGRANGESSCARRASGQVACWGWITGDGSATPGASSRPLAIPGVTDAIDLALGPSHACAVRSGGSVVCWGSNAFGLGDGSSGGYRTTPVTVMGLSDAIRVGAGLDHTCAVRSGGTMVCWGENQAGQLGRGGTVDSLVPVDVATVTNIAVVRASASATCALDLGGAVWCWGENQYGVLGRDDGRSLTPVQIASPRDFTSLSTALHVEVCGRRTSSAHYCWGVVHDAPRPDGGLPRALTPMERPEYAGASYVSPGANVDCAVMADARVWCRGANSFGQLGDNTTTLHLELAPVSSP